MPYITKAELKKYLNIEDTFTEDDAIIETLIAVAELSISEYCNGGLAEYDDASMPVTVKQAALLLGIHLYSNRNIVSFGQPYEIPYSFKFLLNFYKILTIG